MYSIPVHGNIPKQLNFALTYKTWLLLINIQSSMKEGLIFKIISD